MNHRAQQFLAILLWLMAGINMPVNAQSAIDQQAWQAVANQFQVVSETTFAQMPYVVQANYDASTTVTDSQFFARGLTLAAGAKVDIFHKQNNLFDPAQASVIGIQLVKVGSGMVTQIGDPSVIKITAATTAITPGDRIIISNVSASVSIPPLPINTAVTARIIGQLTEGNIQVGSLVILNYGSERGAMMGQKLIISKPLFSRKATNGKPLQVNNIGEIVILRTFAQASYAGITRAFAPIMILDKLSSEGMRTK